MLANPVVIPAYACPEVWAVAALAMWAEIRTEIALLRRYGPASSLTNALVLLNCTTWLAFLIAIDRMDSHGMLSGWGTAGLELGVVVVESSLLWFGLRAWARSRHQPTVPILRVASVALVGNLVSIAVSLTPVAVLWLLR